VPSTVPRNVEYDQRVIEYDADDDPSITAE
jgi:hypothetical protein